ncbi:MAG TPA: SCO family protein, partial [Candidatus Limnocylindria bacterium]|nr:SCO family protein [Candidatus Limnocylindria bacterium]
ACTARAVPLHGTELEGNEAPDFTLTDGASGASITLSSFRGQVIAMAFLYTRCPDICPLTAAKMRAAQRALGADASRLVLLAVSVDPEGDTPDAVRAFSAAHDLRDGWHYLVAPRTQLERVWSLYGVGAFRAGSGPLVDHNDTIYVIDREGREREIVHSDIALEDLVADLRALLR